MFIETNVKDYSRKNIKGTLYLLEIEVDGYLVYKVGVTARKPEERWGEILESHFKSYRWYPYMRPKRYRKVEDVYEKESILLDHLELYKFNSKKPFSGCQELVYIPTELIVEIYEKVINGEELEEPTKIPTNTACAYTETRERPRSSPAGVGESSVQDGSSGLVMAQRGVETDEDSEKSTDQ